MLRRSTTVAVTALVTGVLLSAPSSAAAETCQGRPATIVGTGPDIQGTEGDDVIVTGASRITDAGAGDDLICVSSIVLEAVYVRAGDGDDVVDASRSDPSSMSWTKAFLGTGLDRYVGNPAYDEVYAHGVDDNVVGARLVILDVSGPVTGLRGTYASKGWGADNAVHGSHIRVVSSDQDVEIDLAGHLAVAGVQVADIAGFSNASVVAPRAIVRGNAEDNMLRASGCHVSIVGKGGDDYLDGYVGEDEPSFECVNETTMRGGSGDDEIIGFLGNFPASVGGPSDVGRNRLIGNAGNDKLRGGSVADVLLGGRGRDELSGGGGADVLRGDRGRDTLRGQPGRDVLLGNRGRDRADGGRGRDVCVAERERRCER